MRGSSMRRATIIALVTLCCVGMAWTFAIAAQPRPPVTRLFPFSNGEGRKWGYIDAQGNTVIPPKYHSAGYFHEGRAVVWRKAQDNAAPPACIDENGRVVFELPADCWVVNPFSEGIAWFLTHRTVKYGGYDRDGKLIVGPKYDNVGDFSEGLARVNQGAA